jgi:hypothetical protein
MIFCTVVVFRIESDKLSRLTTQSLPRIHIPKVSERLQPDSAPFRYPSYSRDWGVEQDFLEYLETKYQALTTDVANADFVYIPIFWTRYHLWNDYGRYGLEELQAGADELLHLGKPTFTLCQYDDGPKVNLGETRVYLSSRQSDFGVDAPLLASPLPAPFLMKSKRQRHLASFVGRSSTHPLRERLLDSLAGINNLYLSTKSLRPRKFSRLLRDSVITLAPRGYGGSSFRFFEAIQSGSIPWLIGDYDTRPFKAEIDWDRGSFFSSSVKDFHEKFSRIDDFNLPAMEHFVVHELAPRFRFGAWNELLIRDLSRTLGSM